MYCNEIFFFKEEKVIIRLLLYHTAIVKILFPTRIYKLKNISYLVFYVDHIHIWNISKRIIVYSTLKKKEKKERDSELIK